MPTLQLVLICATVLGGTWIVSRALLERDQRRAQLQREVAMHERAAAEPARELAAATEKLAEVAGQLGAAIAAVDAYVGGRAPSRVGSRIVVHTTPAAGDGTFVGVVDAEYSDRIVLRDAEAVSPRGNQPLPGRSHIDRTDVSWIDDLGDVTVPDRPPAEVA